MDKRHERGASVKPKAFNKKRFWLVAAVLTALYALLLINQIGVVTYWVWSFNLSDTADLLTAIISAAILALVSSYALCKSIFADGFAHFFIHTKTEEERKLIIVRTFEVLLVYVAAAVIYTSTNVAQTFWWLTPMVDLFNIGGISSSAGDAFGDVAGGVALIVAAVVLSYIIALFELYIEEIARKRRWDRLAWLVLPFIGIFVVNFAVAYFVGPYYTGATFDTSKNPMAICSGETVNIVMTAQNVAAGNGLVSWDPAYNPVVRGGVYGYGPVPSQGNQQVGFMPLEGVAIDPNGTLVWKYSLTYSGRLTGTFHADICNPGLFFDVICYPVSMDYMIAPC
jgi:hypothetical protein